MEYTQPHAIKYLSACWYGASWRILEQFSGHNLRSIGQRMILTLFPHNASLIEQIDFCAQPEWIQWCDILGVNILAWAAGSCSTFNWPGRVVVEFKVGEKSLNERHTSRLGYALDLKTFTSQHHASLVRFSSPQ